MPRIKSSIAALVFVAVSIGPVAHGKARSPDTKGPPAAKAPWFLDPAKLPLGNLIASPPAADSTTGRSDLAEVHRIEKSRTTKETKAAQYDDTHEDIFIFATVLGDDFNEERYPITAMLSAHLRNDAGIIDNPLKQTFGRLRPYNLDPTLHPICETNQESSYPSGHALNGYLYAFALAEMVPEQHDAILRRADEYAYHRVVCGSHYVSDTQASRQVASFVFGNLLANPRFQQELDAATRETRRQLHLAPVNSK